MTPEQFNHYAQQGYNRIPVSREVLADLDTPLSAYLKLADGAYSYLFESDCPVKRSLKSTAIKFG